MKKKTILKFQSVTYKLLSAIFLSVCIISFISVHHLFAEVPCKINYQGRLIENNVPVDGTKTMKFTIYNSAVGGTLRWTSEDVSVEVHNGLFRYVLGEGFIEGSPVADLSSINWTAGETLYLEVKVETDILTPREELYAYPYAINSHLLEGATKEYFLNISGETQKKDGGLNIMGDVGIGRQSPQAKLHIGGTPGTDGIMFPDGTLQTTAGGGLGDWVDMTAQAGEGSVQGPAATDGIVTAYERGKDLFGYTDASSTADTRRIHHLSTHSSCGGGITMPVKKGHYWKVIVEYGQVDAVYWIPLGN